VSVGPMWFVDLLGTSRVVHEATGMVAVQIDADLEAAAVRLRAEADAMRRPVEAIAADVVARRVRLA
jgi:hypothetical protein